MATDLEQVKADPKLQFASPVENELRNIYPFANLFITFPTKPYKDNSVVAPAYLKKIDDTFTPSFTPTTVFGRTDPIPTYKGTARKMSLSFDLPAFNEFDANEILKKIKKLVINLYPGYFENRGQKIINSPPLVRVKFANLIANSIQQDLGLLGYMDALQVSHNFTEASPLIAIDNFGGGYFYSKNYSITFNFNVLHEQIIGWNDSDGTTYFPQQDYPYVDFPESRIPGIEKPAGLRALTSNLRGTFVNDPASAKATTLILGGSATSGFGL